MQTAGTLFCLENNDMFITDALYQLFMIKFTYVVPEHAEGWLY